MKRRKGAPRGRDGYTLLELMIATVVVGTVVIKTLLLVEEAAGTIREQPLAMLVDDKAYEVLDKITLAILGADAASLTPNSQSPLHESGLEYRISMGVEDGEVVWGDPEEVSLVPAAPANQVVWRRNPGAPGEIRSVWARFVESLLEGEVGNGADDNGNGLVDEQGLTFVVEGNVVTIRLTLARATEDGRPYHKTVETTVTCRNDSA